MSEPQYTGEFENFYPLPLNDEALECVLGATLVVDQRLLRSGGRVRWAVVLDVRDDADGRRVSFQECASN